MSTEQYSSQQWSSGLLDSGDLAISCTTFICPCITFGEIAEIVDEGESSCLIQGLLYTALMLIQCHWLLSYANRGKLRRHFGLPADPCHDLLVHFFCGPCALCQEYDELVARGFDPSQGWKEPSLAPPQMPPSMIR